jgi:hypothetical protein
VTTDMMTRFIEQRPFVPFETLDATGRKMEVRHPDFITSELHVMSFTVRDLDGRAEIFDTALIVSIRTLEPMP